MRFQKDFTLLRLCVCISTLLLYLASLCLLQELWVRLLGRSALNYILGACIGFVIATPIMHVFNYICMRFVQCLNISAISYKQEIEDRGINPVTGGFIVLKKNFGTVTTYFFLLNNSFRCVQLMVEKLAKLLSNSLFVQQVSAVLKFYPVQRFLTYTLDSFNECLVAYTIRYKDKGSADNLSVVGDAVVHYVRMMPDILGIYLERAILAYALPIVVRLVVILFAVMLGGIGVGVTSIIVTEFIWIALKTLVADPLYTSYIVEVFLSRCTEEDSGDKLSPVVDEMLGFFDLPPITQVEEQGAEEPISVTESATAVIEPMQENPIAVAKPIIQPTATGSKANLDDLLSRYQQKDVAKATEAFTKTTVKDMSSLFKLTRNVSIDVNKLKQSDDTDDNGGDDDDDYD